MVPELDDRVACVIVEAVAANMGLVPPAPGFLEGLRAACDAAGALLVFDEVITGFRLGEGGASGWTGVRPDLWCFGKVIGGGLPVGAFGGRADVLAVLAPLGPVYQAGTLSGNPLATAAGLAVLEHAGPGRLRRPVGAGWPGSGRRSRGPDAALVRPGTTDADGRQLTARVPVVGPLFGLFFVPGRLRPGPDYDGRRGLGGDRPVRAAVPGDAGPWRGPGPRPLRGGVPLAGPRRGRATTTPWTSPPRPSATPLPADGTGPTTDASLPSAAEWEGSVPTRHGSRTGQRSGGPSRDDSAHAHQHRSQEILASRGAGRQDGGADALVETIILNRTV